jgi:hypothetical protein
VAVIDLVAESAKRLEAITAILALLAALFAGYAAWLSYRLAKSIRDELKSDEVLIGGVLHNPDLLHPDHQNAVIQTTLFNKAKRKAFVHAVVVKNSKGEIVDVDWADRIDQYGNPQGGSNLIGVVDSAELCIRTRDGQALREVTVEVSHSFPNSPLVLRYSIDPGWQAYFAK